jgi:DNA polymerase-4
VERVRNGRTYIDLTGTERLFGVARDTASQLQHQIRRDLRLETRLGVATNKLVSNVASKVVTPPRGVENVAVGDEREFLAPMPVGWIPGVGKHVAEALADLNIRRVGELREIPTRHLTLAFGRVGFVLSQRARGIDPTPVYPPRRKPGIQFEETLASDSNERSLLLSVLYRLIERAGRRLRSMGKAATRITVRLRHADGREARRSVPLNRETDLDDVMFEKARLVLEKLLERRVRIRWLALVADDLAEAPRQLELFTAGEAPQARSLLSALDRLRTRHGEDVVLRGLPAG